MSEQPCDDVLTLQRDLARERRSCWLLRISVACLATSLLLSNWEYWRLRHNWLAEAKATLARVEGLQGRVNGLQDLVNNMAQHCGWRLTTYVNGKEAHMTRTH